MALTGRRKVQATFRSSGNPLLQEWILKQCPCHGYDLTKRLSYGPGTDTQGCFHAEKTVQKYPGSSACRFPVVVSMLCGSSVGVYIVNQKEYEMPLNGAYSYEDEVVVEEYIKGRCFLLRLADGEASIIRDREAGLLRL